MQYTDIFFPMPETFFQTSSDSGSVEKATQFTAIPNIITSATILVKRKYVFFFILITRIKLI